jgi:outer membrane protein assembly factor BamB
MRRSSFHFPLLFLLGFAALFLAAMPLARAGDVLTQHYNNARIGAALDETILNTSNVNRTRFGKLWTLYADGQIVAQPLYVSGLAIDTSTNPNAPLVQGTFNAVVIATMHNTVYVYDADKESPGPEGRTVPLWATWLGKPRPGGKDLDMWSTNDPEWGILSTPVISDDKSTIYVVAWHDDGAQGFAYRLHALNLHDGTHRTPPALIGAASTDPSQPCKPQSAFNPCVHKQRPALLLLDGVVYIGFGGDGNRGALFAFEAQTLTRKAVWSSTPTGSHGGIWQSGQGPAADPDGNVYLMTGNGTFDAHTGGPNFGNSFVKLKLQGQNFTVEDSFTPCNFGFLNSLDLDLGSAGPVLLPVNPRRIISGGKEGVLYVLSQDNMGRFAASPDAPNCQNTNAVQQVHAFTPQVHNGNTHYGNLHGSPVYWKGPDAERVYAWGENSPLKAYRFKQGKLLDTGNPETSAYQPPMGMPGGMLAISADGRKRGSGIVWAVVPLDGDANQQRGVKGIVLALDAQHVSHTLWTSEQFSQRDRLGLFGKFTPPVVANGKVFVTTYGDDEPLRTYGGGTHPPAFPENYYVAVYGLLGPEQPHPTVVHQDRDDVAVIRAVTQPLVLDTDLCAAMGGASLDCTDALAEAAETPAFHQVVLPPGGAAGCRLLRVTAAGKDAGVANSSGIGFWSAQAAAGNQPAEDQGRFVAKSQLKATGTAALLDGSAATLYEFVGVSNCPAGGSGAFSRLFKPYMQFEGAADGKILRNWDRAENYRIGPDVLQFDRSADVIQP